MAVGGIISDVFTSSTTALQYFQPAAGVEIMITAITGTSSCRVALTDGANISEGMIAGGTGTSDSIPSFSTKIGITNAHYLGISADSSRPAYTGIQIK